MPRKGRTGELVRLERKVAASSRFVDLAVALRKINADKTPGALLPGVIGGVWDTWAGQWVHPRPSDIRVFEWTIQEQQVEIVRLPSAIWMVGIFAGRQAGKSRSALQELGKDALIWPGRDSFVVSLDFKASREPEETFRALIAPWWRVDEEKADRTWRFPHGHRVMFRSAENINSCLGPNTKTIVLEEASRMKETVYQAALGNGAASEGFRLLLPTTPKRETEWIRRVDRTWNNEAGSRIVRLKTYSNPFADRQYLERVKAELPADLYEQEFEGKLVPPQDAVYAHLFNRALHIRRPGKLPDSATFRLKSKPIDVTRAWTQRTCGVAADLIAGWDFLREATVIGRIYRDGVEIEQNRRRKMAWRYRLWVSAAVTGRNTTTDHHARKVADMFGTSIAIWTDAMGQHAGASGRGGDEPAGITVLREAGFAFVEPVASRNPRIEDRVRTVCRALRDARKSDEWPDTAEWPGGEVRLFIAPDSPATPTADLTEALEGQRMKHGKPEKDDKFEHVLDALGYLTCAVLPLDDVHADGFEYPFAAENDS